MKTSWGWLSLRPAFVILINFAASGRLLTACNKWAKLEKDNKLFSSYKVKAIDTTGAGDIFNAGLVCQISKGKTIEEAIDFANACSALEVTKKGVVDAIPTYDEVIKFMKG